MEGRDTGSLTNRLTEQYLRHQFELMGLEPGGVDGTYYQTVNLAQRMEGKKNRFILTQEDQLRSVEGEFM